MFFVFVEIHKSKYQLTLNPNYALELHNEKLNSNKSVGFIGFRIAPIWLNQKIQQSN